MIVIDIGCARYGGDFSIERLIDEFDPDVLYGFDPSDEIAATADADWDRVNDTKLKYLTSTGVGVILSRQAAWTYDGEIGFEGRGLGGHVTDDSAAEKVPCFDLARFITELGQNDIVLKIDAEGAEYDLLDHLIETRADALLKLAWVEFHPPFEGDPMRRSSIEERIACELVDWRW